MWRERRRVLGLLAGGAGVAAGFSVLSGATRTESSAGGVRQESPRADYYIAPDGDNDNAGSIGDPFSTIERGLEAASPGETVFLTTGTYLRSETIEIEDVSGEEGEPIRVVGDPEDRPVVTWADDADDEGIVIDHCRYLAFENIDVTRSPNHGLRVRGRADHITFRNVHTYENSRAGIAINNSPYNRLLGVVSHDNYDEDSGGNNADGVQISGPNARDNLIRGARTFRNSDDGIDLFKSKQTTIEHSISWKNGFDPDGKPVGDGNGFKLGGGEEENGDNLVIRCIAHGNRRRGFDYNTATKGNVLLNNTAWNNPFNYRFQNAEHVLTNNISAKGELLLDDEIDENRNTWNLDIDDPEFVSTDPGDERFLHLEKGSPAIDAGAKVDIEYAGDAPDLGAIERGG